MAGSATSAAATAAAGAGQRRTATVLHSPASVRLRACSRRAASALRRAARRATLSIAMS